MSADSQAGAPKLYGELASWWPLLSDPADYAEEAATYWAGSREGQRREPCDGLEENRAMTDQQPLLNQLDLVVRAGSAVQSEVRR